MEREDLDFSIKVDLGPALDKPKRKRKKHSESEKTNGAADPNPDWHFKNADGSTGFLDGLEESAVVEPTVTAAGRSALDVLNDEYFHVAVGSKNFVAYERFDYHDGRKVVEYLRFSEFHNRLAGRFYGDRKLSYAWLSWSGHRKYLNGIVFDPSGGPQPEGTFNLWRGWPIPPKKGDWGVLRAHIRDIICSGDRILFRWIIAWMCKLVQKPAEPGGIVAVLRGEEGAGKSLFGTAIRRMFGQHAMAVSSPRALIGQFNAHLRDLIFLLADEAVFAGDHAARGQLKALITDPTIFIEAKGIDASQVRNFIHVLMTSNRDWVVPVSIGDRRFAVFDVSTERKGDHAYFDRLAAAIQNDDVIAAMLYDLLNTPLGNFDVRNIPDTNARCEQMQHSLEGAAAWLVHALSLGDLGLPGPNVGWATWASMRDLQIAHEAWAKGAARRMVESPEALGRFLSRFFRHERPRCEGSRPWGYKFGTIHEARARFCEVMRFPITMFAGEEEDE